MQLSTQTVTVHYRALRSLDLPFHAGSAWRGALKSAADASDPKLLFALFGVRPDGVVTSNDPRPWLPVLEAPRRLCIRRGAPLALELRFVGRVFDDHRNELEGLLTRMGARVGNKLDDVTPRHDAPPQPSLQLRHVDLERPIRHHVSTVAGPPGEDEIMVKLITPTELRVDRQRVTEPTFLQLARVAARRLRHLADLYGTWTEADDSACHAALASAEPVRTVRQSLRELRWDVSADGGVKRRQARGVLGSITYAGPARAALPLLHAAEVLHLGRDITYGAGRIRVYCRDTSNGYL